METVGSYLQSERMARNLSLEKVAQETKIRVSRLEEIEKNRFDEMGGYGYARATVVNYARFIEADEKKAVYLLEQQMPAQTFKVAYTPSHDEDSPRNFLLPAGLFRYLLIGVLGIGLLFTGIHLYNKGIFPLNLQGDEQTAQSAENGKTEKSVQNTVAVPESLAAPDSVDYVRDFVIKDKTSPLLGRAR